MPDLDIAVIGAGIAGLTAAHRLGLAGREAEVFEAEPEVGGRMRSRRVRGYVIDQGAESFAPYGYEASWELIRELGVDQGGELNRIRYPVGLWRQGRIYRWLGHPLSVLTGAGMPARGRGQLARLMAHAVRHYGKMDPDRPEETPYGTLTLTQLGERFGAQTVENLLEPAAAAAFGWQPERSCVAPLLSIMLATRGIWGWRTCGGGMDLIARKLAERLTVHTARQVAEVKSGSDGVRLLLADGDMVSARAVLLAVPAPLISGLYPQLPEHDRHYVAACGFSSVLRVSCLLDRPLQAGRDGSRRALYALLIPSAERAMVAGITFEHNKSAGRVPPGRGQVALIFAPRLVRDLLDEPDEKIIELALSEGERYVAGLREACRDSLVVRWRHALPEASPAAMSRRAEFIRRPPGPVEYAGDWLYLRPSSEGAVRSATRLAVPRLTGFLG